MSVWHGVGSEPNLQHKHTHQILKYSHALKKKNEVLCCLVDFIHSWISYTHELVQYIKASLTINTREILLVLHSSDFKD